jgi:hypothetical protein
MRKYDENEWTNDNRDQKKTRKSLGKKKKSGQRHYVRDILRELTTSNGDEYYDYIDEIEK